MERLGDLPRNYQDTIPSECEGLSPEECRSIEAGVDVMLIMGMMGCSEDDIGRVVEGIPDLMDGTAREVEHTCGNGVKVKLYVDDGNIVIETDPPVDVDELYSGAGEE